MQAPQIGATVLEPGASLAVTLEVPLPLERNQPFGDDLGAGPIALPDEPSEVRFCLGLLPRSFTDAAPDEDGVVLLAQTDASAAVQHLLCSDPTPLAERPDRGLLERVGERAGQLGEELAGLARPPCARRAPRSGSRRPG